MLHCGGSRTCTKCLKIKMQNDVSSRPIFPPDRVPPMPVELGRDSVVQAVRQQIAARQQEWAQTSTLSDAQPSTHGRRPSTMDQRTIAYAVVAVCAAVLAIFGVGWIAKRRSRIVPQRQSQPSVARPRGAWLEEQADVSDGDSMAKARSPDEIQ